MVPAEDRILITLNASIPGGVAKFAKQTLSRLRRGHQDEEFAWYYEKGVFDASGIPHVRLDDFEYAVSP